MVYLGVLSLPEQLPHADADGLEIVGSSDMSHRFLPFYQDRRVFRFRARRRIVLRFASKRQAVRSAQRSLSGGSDAFLTYLKCLF
jgi:hypothetical protein